MQAKSYNNLIVKLLISPQLRILRHLVLFLLTLSLAIGIIWGMVEHGEVITPLQKYIYVFGLTIFFWIECSFNIYILTPRLLLKNKWWKFFISLIGLVLSVMIVIVFTQTMYIITKQNPFDTSNAEFYDYFKVTINISSSILSLFLLFAGTSTFVLFKNWILDMKQSEELESSTLQLELKLLENQINPHFLFNMLNSANIMVKKDPDTAIHIIGKLEEMLRYLMNDSIHERVFLEDEIVFLTDFLELEKTRRDYFSYTVSSQVEDNIQVPPLLFITFVENAVKHNQDSRKSSFVNILFRTTNDKLLFVCENSIPQQTSGNKEVGGIGLANIKRRLNLLYKENYSLQQEKTNTSYTVNLELSL